MNKFILCVTLLCATFLPQFLSAETLRTVTSLDDDGPGTLREAVNLAEEGDIIIFDASLQGDTIILENGEIDILVSLTITGITDENDKPAITIRVPVTYQDSLETGLETSKWRIFHIYGADNNINVTLENMILQGGDIHNNPPINPNTRAAEDDNNGGIIMVRTATNLVTLNNVHMSEGRAHYGGAVYANDPMQINNCTFERNYAIDGGALYDNSQTIETKGSNFFYNHAENEGGAVYEAYNANCSFKECYFAFNSAGRDGAAIHTGNSSRAYIERCSFYRNEATASGGAIQNANSCIMTIENSTFVENQSKNGGAVYNTNDATLIAVNSTFAANFAYDPANQNGSRGGAFHITSTVPTTLINNVIAGNYVGTDPTVVKTEVIYVGLTEAQDSSVLNMAYGIYGIMRVDGKVNLVEGIEIHETQTDAFMEEIYNAEWKEVDDRWILANIDTGENIYDTVQHVVPISPYGRAAYQGTLVGKIGLEYFFRDFRDNDGPVRNEQDSTIILIEEDVNRWTSFERDTTFAFVLNSNTAYGLSAAGTGAQIITHAQNKDAGGNYVSRIMIQVAYNVGAYALQLETRGTMVQTNIDILNPFDGIITLRDAVEAYAGLYGLDNKVTFDPSVFKGDGVNDTIKLRERNIWIDRPLTIEGNGTDKVIISGQNMFRVFAVNNVNNDTVFINNLTITDGRTSQYGAGIKSLNSSVVLDHLKITNCHAEIAAGGFYLYQANYARISNVLFEENYARDNGGGAYNEMTDSLWYINCTFVKNEINEGWSSIAMHNLNASPRIINTVMWGNTGGEDSEALGYALGEELVYNCLIEGRTVSTDVSSLPGDTDPMFVDFDGGDYRPDRCSPLINAGDNTYVISNLDLAYEDRIVDDIVDIGAYESQNPAPPVAVWSPENNTGATDAEKQDWNNPLNWIPQFTPAECTDVYIRSITPSGTNMHFPDLKDTTGICESIYFMQGGQIAQPQNLTYNRAHVQFNFNLEDTPQRKNDTVPVKECEIEERLEFSARFTRGSIERDQWNMLSSPMHSVVSGDFAFGGYPMTFMRKFDMTAPSQGTYPTGSWSELYASLDEELGLGEGFILWINGYKDEDAYKEQNTGIDSEISPVPRTYGIYETNGIIELPYYEDSIMVDAHRIEKQEGTISTFYYIWYEDVPEAAFLDLTGESDTYDRGENNKAFRFIVEEYVNGKWQFPATSTKPITNPNATAIEVLVGNPYMSTIDFIEFYNDNSSNIEPQYRLWTGDKFATATIVNGQIVSTDGLDQYISPMQSFFILTKGGGNFDLVYNVANITVPKPITSDSELRNAKSTKETNILRIKAENGLYTSETLIAKTNNASDNYKAGEDVYKLFSQKGNVPEIFTLADNYALEMNFINSNNILIPMGIKTQKTGTTTFTFTGMDNYESEKIEFIDGELNQTIDLTGQSIVEYTFNNLTEGINTGRFFIRFAEKQVTSITDIDEQIFVDAYRNENGIFITASDLIKQITVYDLQGHILYNNDVINSSWFTINQRFEANPVIVKVVTEKGVANIKLMKY